MNTKIIFSIALIMISLGVVAFAQLDFSSITVTPTSYDIDMTGGDTKLVDVTLKSTNDEPIDIEMLTDILYTGNCNNRGQYEDGLDMLVSYCDADGSNCDPNRIFVVPAFGTLPIKVQHNADIAACPGTYTINNTFQFIEQEEPIIQAFGYLHGGFAGYQLPKGQMKIFRKINTDELRLELINIHDGSKISRRCNIVSDHMTFVSRKIVCQSAEAGYIQIFIMPQYNRLTVGFGNKAMFRGILIR